MAFVGGSVLLRFETRLGGPFLYLLPTDRDGESSDPSPAVNKKPELMVQSVSN